MKGMTERSGRVELAPRHAQHSLLLPHVIDQICLGEVNCFTNPESISPIVSPIQNPSEPALNPGLAAEWPEINDPWPDLRDSSHQNSRYTRKSSNHPRTLTFGLHSTQYPRPRGECWRTLMMWQLLCKWSAGWSRLWRATWRELDHFTNVYHTHVSLPLSMHIAKLAICSSGLFLNKMETVPTELSSNYQLVLRLNPFMIQRLANIWVSVGCRAWSQTGKKEVGCWILSANFHEYTFVLLRPLPQPAGLDPSFPQLSFTVTL